jgi:hypothetical protein
MKDYVYIQSNTSIVVTAGLQNDNVTNPDAHIPDRLKVNPVWPKLRVMIKVGRHIYPSLIVEWNTVKSLVKDGIITIGEEVDNPNDVKVEEKAKDLKDELKKIKKVTDIKLEDVAE